MDSSPRTSQLIETIDLSSNPLLKAAGVAALVPLLGSRLPRLVTLELAGCGLTDDAAIAIATALAPNAIGNFLGVLVCKHADDVAPENSCAQAAADVSDMEPAGRPSNNPLQRLVLGNNPIRSDGCAALAAALAFLPELRVLQLGDTEVCDVGGGALVRALDAGWSPRLMQLWLAATKISPDGRMVLGACEMRCHMRTMARRDRSAAPLLRICW